MSLHYDRDLCEQREPEYDDLATAEVIPAEPQTKADRIRAYAAQHPDEGPTKIAIALGGGIKASYVSGVLSEAHRVAQPAKAASPRAGRLLPLVNEAAEVVGGLRELYEFIGVLLK